jgi:hypothetical protein
LLLARAAGGIPVMAIIAVFVPGALQLGIQRRLIPHVFHAHGPPTLVL